LGLLYHDRALWRRRTALTGDNTSLFRVFRVLWFPMSINAMVLGAFAVALFWVGSWIGASVWLDTDDLHATTTSLSCSFPTHLLDVVAKRHWPDDEMAWFFAWQCALFVFLWATFGVAICRVLALRIARDEYCALGTAFGFAWRVKTTGILYPVAVALPIAFLLGCNQAAGMFTSIPFIGWMIGPLMIPLTIIASLMAMLIGIAAVVSIGFLPAAIATERKGTYDSLGKAFNYVFARPIPVILHLYVLKIFIGLLFGLLVTDRLVEGILADTMTPWLWGDEAFGETFKHMLLGQTDHLEGFQGLCGYLFLAMYTAYRLLVWGALIAFILGAFTSLFLILRRDVDGMDYLDIARDPAEAPAHDPAPDPAPESDTPKS